jgi:hypothetical protein
MNSTDFHWREYLIANTDLIDGGIINENDALSHWNDFGRNQNRKLKSDKFDWKQYIAINQDLINNGFITKSQIEEHYIECGYKEKRTTLLKDFDWRFYITYNNHLLNSGITSQTRAIRHWISYGSSEGLITTIKPLQDTYDKFIKHSYNNAFNIYDKNIKVTVFDKIPYEIVILPEKNIHIINHLNTHLFKKLEFIPTLNEILYRDDLILIVDFPCLGGGCSFFINSIISNYKHTTGFLIVRNFKNKIYWYLNDEKIVDIAMNDEEAIDILNSFSHTIKKIFINSIVGHSDKFINAIFKLDKEKTTVTHDYSLFFDKPQVLFHELNELSRHNKINVHNFDRIVTQHIGNLHTLGNSLDGYGNIVVSELPDFYMSGKRITSNSDTFIIGIIGYISDVKGYVLLNEIAKKIAKKKNIEIVIFGKAHISKIKQQFSYENIEDLNKLLEKHRPNILLELSIWPESFSFTLTLAMLTGLPIIYQNKFMNNTVQRRLALYKNAHMFDNVYELNVDWLMSKGQPYFNLIYPSISFPPFWDYYFKNNEQYMPYKLLNQEYNVVMITSKVYTSTTPFTYTPQRSIYSPKERFEQTLETIRTVRKHIPNSFIVLFDNSTSFTDDEFIILKSYTDYFINNCNDNIVNNLTNHSVHKLYGEIAQTYKIIQYLNIYHKEMNIKNIFKITGRYLINDNFSYNTYENEDIIFKRNNDVEDRLYYFTCFYKISKKQYNFFRDTIFQLYEDIQHSAYEYEEWEVLLPNLLYGHFKCVDELGVTQNIAVWDDKSNI